MYENIWMGYIVRTLAPRPGSQRQKPSLDFMYDSGAMYITVCTTLDWDLEVFWRPCSQTCVLEEATLHV